MSFNSNFQDRGHKVEHRSKRTQNRKKEIIREIITVLDMGSIDIQETDEVEPLFQADRETSHSPELAFLLGIRNDWPKPNAYFILGVLNIISSHFTFPTILSSLSTILYSEQIIKLCYEVMTNSIRN